MSNTRVSVMISTPAQLAGMFQQQYSTPPVCRGGRTHKSRGTCADDDHILLRHRSALLFRLWPGCICLLSGGVQLADLFCQWSTVPGSLATGRPVSLQGRLAAPG